VADARTVLSEAVDRSTGEIFSGAAGRRDETVLDRGPAAAGPGRGDVRDGPRPGSAWPARSRTRRPGLDRAARWLRQQQQRHFDTPGTPAAFDEAFDAVLAMTACRDLLDRAITKTAAAPPGPCWLRGPGTTAGSAARPPIALLRHRWPAMSGRPRKSNVIAVAIARQLTGWCWSLATMTE